MDTTTTDRLRSAIMEAARDQGRNPNSLATASEGRLVARTVQRYFSGEMRLTDEKVSVLMSLLGIGLRMPKKKSHEFAAPADKSA